MENYYSEIQNQIKELKDFDVNVKSVLNEITDFNQKVSQKESKKYIRQYIEELRLRYQNMNQLFFCDDYLVDGILTDFAAFCKQQQIKADILFQNYHKGNIKSEDSIAILLKLIEYAKQTKKVKLHAAAVKNQLVYSVELQDTNLKISPRAFKKYIKKYDGGINIESKDGKTRIILGLRR